MREYLLLFFVCMSANADVFYNLDNKTIASYDEKVDDPFIVIRTKVGSKEKPYSLTESWYNYSQFSPFEWKEDEVSESIVFQSESISPEVVFEYKSPHFEVSGEQTWWQISRDVNFTSLLPNCNCVQENVDRIQLDPITETFLNSGETYYFRYSENESDWCDPVRFVYNRPESVQDVVFEKIGDQRFEIRWKEESDPEIRFWIFASNALDFVPSIYTTKQINVANESEVIAEELNDNLVAITKDNCVEIDGEFAFYRIVAEKQGCYSVPSPLIRVWDVGMTHQRTILQRVGQVAKRILFPADIVQRQGFFVPHRGANVKHPLVDQSVWDAVTPYLMPLNHPIRAQLDRLFSSQRVLLNSESLRNAGFPETKPHMFSHAIISENKKIKGYFFKMFSDSQPNLLDWEQWVRRAYGAASATITVLNQGLRKHIVVPKKWIYPLPPEPSPPPGYHRKFFVLVAEKLKLENREKNYNKWGKKMTRERLRAIVILIQAEGLVDNVYAFNLPFAKDGRNALIDTEHNHHWPVHFSIMKRWLAPHMQGYLDELKAELAQ